MNTSRGKGSGTQSSLKKRMALAYSKIYVLFKVNSENFHSSSDFFFRFGLKQIFLPCRMPDPDFSVSDVKLFVGKFLVNFLTE